MEKYIIQDKEGKYKVSYNLVFKKFSFIKSVLISLILCLGLNLLINKFFPVEESLSERVQITKDFVYNYENGKDYEYSLLGYTTDQLEYTNKLKTYCNYFESDCDDKIKEANENFNSQTIANEMSFYYSSKALTMIITFIALTLWLWKGVLFALTLGLSGLISFVLKKTFRKK